MSLISVLATIVLTVLSLPISKGAFVGAFALDGKALPLPAPMGEQWVSSEQVQRELLFRGWTPPLTSAQMADLAKGLEADFAVDILVVPLKGKKKWQALIVMRVVSASLREIVHLAQIQSEISDPEELPQVAERILPTLLTKLPPQFPLATVQLCESDRRVHLSATGGDWKKGMKLLFFRTSGGQIVLLGKGRILSANIIIGGNRWVLEADLSESKAPIRPSDKAVQIFTLPKPLAKWR